MITVVIPAAGEGSRFRQAGYTDPKLLIPVLGIPMVYRVLANVTPVLRPSHTVVVHRGDLEGWVALDRPTGGALETILRAEGQIDPDDGLLLANCDQLITLDPDRFVAAAEQHDGAVVVFPSSNPHHSYVEADADGIITRIVEKEVISRHAVSGVYYFTRASEFIAAAKRAIAGDQRVKGEFYVSTAIGLMLEAGAKLIPYPADTAILGTPDELQLFEMAARVAADL